MSHNLETTEVIDDPISNEDIVNQDTSDEDVEMMTNNYEISGNRPIYNEEGELREAINNTSREEAQRAIQAAITLQSMRIQEQMELDENVEEEIPEEFKCPISLDLMQDPVLAADGHSYDRAQIESWFRTSHTSPNTRLRLNTLALYPNIELRNRINSWLSERNRPELPPPRQNRHAVNTTNRSGGRWNWFNIETDELNYSFTEDTERYLLNNPIRNIYRNMSSRYNFRGTNRPRYNREQTISNARSLIEQELREATQSDLRAARDLIDRELDSSGNNIVNNSEPSESNWDVSNVTASDTVSEAVPAPAPAQTNNIMSQISERIQSEYTEEQHQQWYGNFIRRVNRTRITCRQCGFRRNRLGVLCENCGCELTLTCGQRTMVNVVYLNTRLQTFQNLVRSSQNFGNPITETNTETEMNDTNQPQQSSDDTTNNIDLEDEEQSPPLSNTNTNDLDARLTQIEDWRTEVYEDMRSFRRNMDRYHLRLNEFESRMDYDNRRRHNSRVYIGPTSYHRRTLYRP